MVPGSAPQGDPHQHTLVRELPDRWPDEQHHGNFGEPEQAQRDRSPRIFGDQLSLLVFDGDPIGIIR